MDHFCRNGSSSTQFSVTTFLKRANISLQDLFSDSLKYHKPVKSVNLLSILLPHATGSHKATKESSPGREDKGCVSFSRLRLWVLLRASEHSPLIQGRISTQYHQPTPTSPKTSILLFYIKPFFGHSFLPPDLTYH